MSAVGYVSLRSRANLLLTLECHSFRPNIVLRGGGPFAEDVWEEIRIGSDCGIRLVSKCARCLVSTANLGRCAY